jgi:hypothetical protein
MQCSYVRLRADLQLGKREEAKGVRLPAREQIDAPDSWQEGLARLRGDLDGAAALYIARLRTEDRGRSVVRGADFSPSRGCRESSNQSSVWRKNAARPDVRPPSTKYGGSRAASYLRSVEKLSVR